MMFSYFPYAAAFAGSDGIDGGLVAVALALAPLVFILLAFISRNPKAPRRVLEAMVMLLGVGFTVGLFAPVLGAAAGFGAGGAICLLPPDIPNVAKWRISATVFMTFYTFVLLVTVTPAGVFSGGLLPLMMVGFGDEYAVWSARRSTADGGYQA
jgi:hypothetical protein